VYISKTNKSAYWTVRAAHSGTMQLFLEGVVEKYAGWKVEASVEETVTWAASRTARIALEGAVEDPDHPGLEDFLRSASAGVGGT
jgi:hypothetical protein